MDGETAHPALHMRLVVLQRRMAALRATVEKSTGITKIEAHDHLIDLEKRHRLLAEQLRTLDAEGAGLWQTVKAEFDLMADDLASAIDDLLMSIGHPRHR